MLVLNRKPGQKIYINGGNAEGGLTLTVIEVRKDVVRLGFEAPPEIVIERDNVVQGERTQSSNSSSTGSSSSDSSST